MRRESRMSAVSPRYGSRFHPRGLTLLELIVVLVILAALGTVMLTQTTTLTSEVRYEQTVRTLEQLQDAIVGRPPYAGEDPTAVPAGFVADIGRLPQIGEERNLAELYDLDEAGSTLPPFLARELTDLDDDLVIASGWRGPYVRRALGSDEICDGWGRSYTLRDAAGANIGSTAATTTEIGSIVSLGLGAGDAFDVDLDAVFRDTSQSLEFAELLVPDTNTTSGDEKMLLCNVQYTLPPTQPSPPDATYVVVRIYGPTNGLPAVLWQSPPLAAIGTPGQMVTVQAELTDADDPVPVGPKLVRAYQWNSSTEPAETDDLTSQTKSQALRVTVKAGGVWWPDLNLEGQ